MQIDRVAVNRALAKAIAYKQCMKDAQAEAWAAEVVRLIEFYRAHAARLEGMLT